MPHEITKANIDHYPKWKSRLESVLGHKRKSDGLNLTSALSSETDFPFNGLCFDARG
jgi:hypothetical protein